MKQQKFTLEPPIIITETIETVDDLVTWLTFLQEERPYNKYWIDTAKDVPTLFVEEKYYSYGDYLDSRTVPLFKQGDTLYYREENPTQYTIREPLEDIDMKRFPNFLTQPTVRIIES